MLRFYSCSFFFFFNDTATTEIYTLSLHDALPISRAVTSLPIAVGFGISLPGHVSVLGGLADAAVVGSALVAEIEKAQSVDAAAVALAERVRSFKEAARHGLSRRDVPIHRGEVTT